MIRTGALNFKPITAFDQALIVVFQDLRLRDNPPLNFEEEFQLEHGQLIHGNSPDARIRLVCPETITETLASHRGTDDQEPMDGQTRHGEGGVQGAETIDIIHHAQQDRWRECRVGRQTLQVILHGDPGR